MIGPRERFADEFMDKLVRKPEEEEEVKVIKPEPLHQDKCTPSSEEVVDTQYPNGTPGKWKSS
jgi:hypothetical protein